MRKLLLLILVLSLLNCKSKNEKPPQDINVLFIGNSLTYYNDMPQMLQKMVHETNPDIVIDQITFPGMSISDHMDKIIESHSGNNLRTRSKKPGEITETEKKIKEKDWDIIILQTGGVSVLIPESVEYKINPAIQRIKTLAGSKTSYILFNTWATSEDFPREYCYRGFQIAPSLERMKEYCSASIENEKDYLSKLNDSYKSIAENNVLEKTDHGVIFQKVFNNHPELEILEDEMHPSKLGAFLSAGIFYEKITRKDVSTFNYTGDLAPEKVELLKNIIKRNNSTPIKRGKNTLK